MVKNLPDSAGDLREVDSIPGLARYPGREHGEKGCNLQMKLSALVAQVKFENKIAAKNIVI